MSMLIQIELVAELLGRALQVASLYYLVALFINMLAHRVQLQLAVVKLNYMQLVQE